MNTTQTAQNGCKPLKVYDSSGKPANMCPGKKPDCPNRDWSRGLTFGCKKPLVEKKPK
ncbi:hypothetical protein KJ780_02430 [Candidatus Micrarchaeota archaeon]|nr:hypothetical protein [Candidatus Micrarchaeota archaeon]